MKIIGTVQYLLAYKGVVGSLIYSIVMDPSEISLAHFPALSTMIVMGSHAGTSFMGSTSFIQNTVAA